jgi:hypothetical protein
MRLHGYMKEVDLGFFSVNMHFARPYFSPYCEWNKDGLWNTIYESLQDLKRGLKEKDKKKKENTTGSDRQMWDN